MAGPEWSIAAERTIGAKRTIGAERTTGARRTGLRRPVGLRPGGLRRMGLRGLGLRGMGLRGLGVRGLGRSRLGLRGLDPGWGAGPAGDHAHGQRDGRTGDEQTQERRYPGNAFLRGRHVSTSLCRTGAYRMSGGQAGGGDGPEDLSRRTVSPGRHGTPRSAAEVSCVR